ncbi:MAG: histidinol-phosphatase [Planctomycetota bacterium]|nr:histidinol-phosphatase [Planctomycetota bacterium]
MILATMMLGTGVLLQAATPDEPSTRWYRGNTHTHTLWSDGDAPPEHAVRWYADHGYQFLVLSDHNVMQEGERWFEIGEGGRLTPARVRELVERSPEGWVETRELEGTRSMRLKDLGELKAAFERPESFLLIPGEEVTDRYRMAEIHINARNLAGVIEPHRGESVAATIQNNLDAIAEHGRRHQRPVLGHLNHPNFRTSLGVEHLAGLRGERFFEVYNGHRSVDNEGASAPDSTEAMWDKALVLRLHEGAGDGGLLYALATDDAHDHYEVDAVSVPGRGWIMVRAERLEADSIIEAMRRGDFYASTGVALRSLESDGRTIRLEVDERPGVAYTVEFIGARATDGDRRPVAEVLQSSSGPRASYRFTGDELYVRARITSDRAHPRPYAVGDLEQAWTQPVRPAKGGGDEP